MTFQKLRYDRGTEHYQSFKTVLRVDSSTATRMVNTELKDQIRISYVGHTADLAKRINDHHFVKSKTWKKATGRDILAGTIAAMRKEDDKIILFVIRYIRWATKNIAKTVESVRIRRLSRKNSKENHIL